MELRQNQIEPTKIGIEYFRETKPVPSIIVAPTAFGKSILIAKIAESIKENLLILQPSKELLEQNLTKYIALGGTASVYSASLNSKKITQVTYATIGSIKNIGSRFKELGFTKMIIDECHFYPRNADSMIGKFLKESNITHCLGLTATPLKLQTNFDINGNAFSKLQMLTSHSKKGRFFREIISISQISEMVELGFWTKLEYEQYDFDGSKLVYNSTKADFTEESLDLTYESNSMDEKIIKKINELSDRKNIIVFVPSVANAINLARNTPNSIAIYGDMNKKEREIAVKNFKLGIIKIIFNVNVLSIGFDHPEIDAIICARPTASLAWFYQALGRGTRISPNKKDCLIVDFSGNVKKFGKIEKLYYKKENTWKLYGENNILLSGIPLHEIGEHIYCHQNRIVHTQLDIKNFVMPFGKYKNEHISKVPTGYIQWMLKEFTWTKYNKNLKDVLEMKIKNV